MTYTISSTNNRLNSVGGTSYTYDSVGNPTAIGATTFGYNLANRLVSVNSGALANYYHNALGQRVRKLVSSVNTYFMYGEDGKLLGEYDNSGNLLREYIYLGDRVIAVIKGTTDNELYYVVTDHLQTPRRILNTSGTILWSWESTPFGDSAPNEDVDNDSVLFTMPIRFPGQYYDSEVSYNYNYFRTYNSDTGRYLQSDPIGLEGGLNTYGYVYQNSLSYMDPLGLKVEICVVQDIVPHTFSCVKNQCRGSYPSGMAGIFFSQGETRNDKERLYQSKCEEYKIPKICSQEKFDSCVYEEQGKNRSYSVFLKNCYQNRNEYIKKCEKLSCLK